MRTDLDKRPVAVKAMEKARQAMILTSDEADVMFERQPIISSSAALDRWFKERKPELTGKCKHCGGKTYIEQEIADDDSEVYRNKMDIYKHCIAHILPKAYFPSVATHKLNWIELCFWGRSCHTNFDNYTLDITELNCYDEVIEKFVAMYPDIDKKERRRIPAVLMQYVEVDI